MQSLQFGGKWWRRGHRGKNSSLEIATRRAETLTGHTAEITSLAFLADSSVLVSGSTDMTVQRWDVNTKASIKPSLALTPR